MLKLGSTVDEPTYEKLTGLNLENGLVSGQKSWFDRNRYHTKSENGTIAVENWGLTGRYRCWGYRSQVSKVFPNGVDKVLELVGASVPKDSLQCIRQDRTACMTGMLPESWSLINFSPIEFIPASVKLTVYDSGQVRSPATAFQQFIHEVEAGKVKLNIGKVFRLEEVVQAHQLMENNETNGKIVVLT